jgi:hypothetical protein
MRGWEFRPSSTQQRGVRDEVLLSNPFGYYNAPATKVSIERFAPLVSKMHSRF